MILWPNSADQERLYRLLCQPGVCPNFVGILGTSQAVERNAVQLSF